jgi:hypothetical protein
MALQKPLPLGAVFLSCPTTPSVCLTVVLQKDGVTPRTYSDSGGEKESDPFPPMHFLSGDGGASRTFPGKENRALTGSSNISVLIPSRRSATRRMGTFLGAVRLFSPVTGV